MTLSILSKAREVDPVITGLGDSEKNSFTGAPNSNGYFLVVLSLPLLWIQIPRESV